MSVAAFITVNKEGHNINAQLAIGDWLGHQNLSMESCAAIKMAIFKG